MRRLVLVVEDSAAALTQAAESLEVWQAPHALIAQVDSLDAAGIAGRHFLGPAEEIVRVEWTQVRLLLCDYQILGQWTGADVVRQADRASVPAIIGMSSDAGFNRLLVHAGASQAWPKRAVLQKLSQGGFNSLMGLQAGPAASSPVQN